MKIYTDGSSRTTSGYGGFGIVICDDNDKILYTISKQYYNKKVTNNQMELIAILIAVLLYGRREGTVIYSDSAYAINTFDNWGFSWRSRGWIKSDGEVPLNLDIIKTYFNLYDRGYRVKFEKVKGHTSCDGNILADKLATGRAKGDVEL